MGFQVSPGVNVSEIDLTTIIPAVSTTTGAFAGHLRWGPVGQRVLVDSEDTLVKSFWHPTTNTAVDFFTAANFLAYGNALYTVRVVNQSSNNILRAVNAISSSNTSIYPLVKNEDDYQENYSSAGVSGAGSFIAKYPGLLGNNLRASTCLTANAFESTLSTTATRGFALGGTTLSAANSAGLSATVFTIVTAANGNISSVTANTKSKVASSNLISQINTTDYLIFNGTKQRKVTARVSSNTSASVTTGWTVTLTLQAGAQGTSTGSNGTVAVTSTKYGWFSPGSYGTGVLTFSNNSTVVTSTANVGSQLTVGDIIVAGPDKIPVKIASIAANGRYFTIQSKYVGNTSTTQGATRRWEFFDYFSSAPGTSNEASQYGTSGDEMHVVIADLKGGIAGTANTILEVYPNLSKCVNAKSEDGTDIYYKNYINKMSRWVWWNGHTGGFTAGRSVTSGLNIATGAQSKPSNVSFARGDDGRAPRAADYINGYNLFKSAQDVDVSLILGGASSSTVAIHILNNICEYRKDCIGIFSPRSADVVNNSGYAGSEVDDIVEFRNFLPSTSYGVLDSGYKVQYDKYNDIFRNIPCNGDVAGTMVRTDIDRDPWYSPAGYNRGQIKNVVRMAYNPNKTDRDQLYKRGINPIVTFPGEGTILFGDKTLLTKPSAFDRINVRRLFIVLEKAIATAAKYTLFEFNDAFTRAQFRSLVEPFLRDVQGRRGITDFRVVCDETNNTPEVIDRNEFIGDIYIKPARSINFIQLNFVAVRTGVDFTEVVGKF
jgi:phage tail sheath protein FI